MSATQCLISLGELADRCHFPLAAIERASRQLRIVAPLKINGVIYLDEGDADRIATRLHQAAGLGTGRRGSSSRSD